MKVLYFHQHFSTPRGSSGTRSYEMASRLLNRGHDVTIVCGSGFLAETGLTGQPVKGMRRGTVDGINVIEILLPYSNYDSLPKRASIFVRYALKSINVARKTDYDVLFATSTPLTAGIPGIAMRILKPRRKFVFEVRDLWPELPKAMGIVKNPIVLLGMSVLEKLTYMAMNAGIALAPGILEGMQRRSAKGKKIAMIPNGCDLELFGNDEEKNLGLIADLPLPKKGLRCVFTGAHGIANGLDAVLDAAAVLKKKGRPDIQLLFIGDGKLKPHLRERAQAEGLTNCTFYDPIPKMKLASALQHVDVGMMILDNVPAFYYGTSPNKFFDYVAAGLPVITNYPGWLASMIKEHECGIAVPPGDAEGFAEALIKFSKNTIKRKQMGYNSRVLSESRFSRDQLANQFVTFLEEIYRK